MDGGFAIANIDFNFLNNSDFLQYRKLHFVTLQSAN